jgi:copper homeostasis protein (lipoprotein)
VRNKKTKKKLSKSSFKKPYFGQLFFLVIAIVLALFLISEVLKMLFVPSLPNSSMTKLPKPTPTVFAIYTGTLPCADCSGIDTILQLLTNKSYSETFVYQGKTTTFTESGTWMIVDSKQYPEKRIYELTSSENQKTYYLQKDKQTITQLDINMKQIIGPFPLDLSKK